MASQNPRSTFSAICISNGLVRVRARATVGPRNVVDYSRAPASHRVSVPFHGHSGGRNVVAAVSSLGSALRLAIEATRTSKPLASRIFVLGPRTIFDFCRRFGSGKPSFLPLVQHPEKSGRSLFHSFQVSPGGFPFDAHLTQSASIAGLVVLSDGHRGSKREIANVRTSSGEVRNVVR